jgi:GntR family histidine utilization transcriptional repressor
MTDSLALDGSGPLHEQIRRAVCAPIISGAWPPGHRVPSEHELMALFGAARMTVNRAMRALADDGLIIRRRRTGSVVASAAGDRAVMSMSGIRATVEAGDQTYAYESDGRPAALEDYWINLAAVPEAGDEPFDMMPPGEWLAARLPWPKSRYVVTALNAGTAMAKLLDLEPGTACLKIDRRSWRDGVPATFVTCLYPGAGHTLTGEVAAP